MAPFSKMGTYERYKLDTTQFLLWLIKSARLVGHTIPLPVEVEVEAKFKSLSLKGAARKKAKEAAAKQALLESEGATSSAAASGSKKYSISTRQILELAVHIGNQDQIVPMTRTVWQSFQRAVRIRKQFGEKYAKDELAEERGDAGEGGGNGHRFFLSVLMECSRLFRNRVSVQSVARKQDHQSEQGKAKEEARPTVYDLLLAVVEDDTVDFELEIEEEENPDTTESAAADFIPEPEVDWEKELQFQKSCLMWDLEAIIPNIEDAWEDNTEGQANDFVAIILTDAAANLVSRKSEKLIQLANEKGVPQVNYTFKTSDKLFPIARTLIDIAAMRKLHSSYLITVLRLDKMLEDWEDEHEFVTQCFIELGLEQNIRNSWSAGPISKKFNKPLLETSLDELSRHLCALADQSSLTILPVFAAEVMRKIRSKDRTASALRVVRLMKCAKQMEDEFNDAVKSGVKFPHTSHDVSQFGATLRQYIFNWPFEEERQIRMRKFSEGNMFCGMHRDYPITSKEKKEAFEEYVQEHGLTDYPGDRDELEHLYQRYIMPPKDGNFLRKSNPAFCGKLNMCLLITNEEFGIAYANASPTIFSMAHMYNALKQLGMIKGEWPDLEQAISWYMKTFFLGELPTKKDQFNSRLMLAAGYSTQMMKACKELREDPNRRINYGKPTGKSFALQPLPMTQILRDYVYGRKTLRQALYALYAQMQSDSSKRKSQSFIDDLGIVAFLKELQKDQYLPAVAERLQFPYLAVTRTCNDLLHKMDLEFEEVSLTGNAASKESWNVPTYRGIGIALVVLGELDDLHQAEKTAGKLGNVSTSTSIVDAAVRAFQEFLDTISTPH